MLCRLAWLTAALTLVLLGIGGAVHATGSSLACPDWPLCHGQVLPEMRGGVAIEHTHRLVASLVGLCTLAIAVLAHGRGGRTRTLGWAAASLVVVQGVLGGITVLLRLSFVASMLHLLVSMIFFGTLLMLAVRTGSEPEDAGPERRPPPRTRGLVTAAIAVVLLQILLGGAIRHGGAAFACSSADLVLCDGDAWPAGLAARTHLLHRAGGLLVLVAVLAASIAALRTDPRRRVRWLALAAPVLVAGQIALGLATVASSIGVVWVTAHLVLAALLLADLLLLHRAMRRDRRALTRATFAPTSPS